MAKINTTTATLHLINSEGKIIAEGCIVHVVSGPTTGRAYRFERVHPYGERGTYRVLVSRKSVHAHFRAFESVHPSILGCDVVRPMTRSEHVKSKVTSLWAKVDDWFWAGVFALIPLAVFEHFHLASKITEVISLGMIGGSGH